MVIATIDFDTQTSLQLFDVVIKRPAQTQQASVVCWLKGKFTRFCIQTVPLNLSVVLQEIIHATEKRRKLMLAYWGRRGEIQGLPERQA
ncbi:hypothetical protein D3C76_1598290 [compost metagenome]